MYKKIIKSNKATGLAFHNQPTMFNPQIKNAMNTFKKRMFLAAFFFGSLLTYSQEKASLSENIGNQFEFILMKSESYQDLKIVKKKWIENLRHDVLGSMSKIESELRSSKLTLTEQKSQIDVLKSKLQQTNALLTSYTNTGPTLTFLGIRFNQKIFSALFSMLLFGSVISVVFFAVRFRKSNAVTVHSKSVLAELEEEYQEYKRKSIEREQKISRQLQNELNKQKQ